MNENEAKFKAYDWDEGVYKLLPSNDIVEAIHIAWNYEFDVYDVKLDELIFSGKYDNEENSEWLEPYGIRLIDDPDGKHRVLQNIETNELYRPNWRE